jgi:PilZ domain
MGPMSRSELSSRLRREAVRYNFHVDAKIVWPSRTRWGRVTNISHTGMFIEITDPPELNANFAVYLAMDTPLRLDCIVRRVVPQRGIGVTLCVPQEAKERFAALLLALAHGSKPMAASACIPSEQPRAMTATAAASRR